MNYELLYTSAPQGLKPGSRGFCTVLSTTGIPINLTQKLESISGYRPLYPPGDAREPNNPICYSHIRFVLAGKNVSVISRTTAYGFDYSQRSNKIAHHVAIYDNAPDCGPAALLEASGVIRSQWDQQCRSISNEPELPKIDLQPHIANTWQSLAGDPGWAGFVAANWLQPSSKLIWIIFNESQSVQLLNLMIEATALLPTSRRWAATFSTYYTNLPPDADCRVRCVLAGSEEAKLARSRGSVIDLTNPMALAASSPEVIAARAGIMIGSDMVAADAPVIPALPTPADTSPKNAPESIAAASTNEGVHLEDIAVANSSWQDVATPGNFSNLRQSSSPASKGLLIPILIVVGLLAAIGVVFYAANALNPYHAMISELQNTKNTATNEQQSSSPDSTTNGASANQKTNVESPTASTADAFPNTVNETIEPLKPRLEVFRIGADQPLTEAIELSELDMRQPLDLARIKLFDVGEPINVEIDSAPGTDLDRDLLEMNDNVLHWKGQPNFQAKPNNGAWTLKLKAKGDINKDLSIVVKDVPDEDIVIDMKLDNTLVKSNLVAGIGVTAVTSEDLDEPKDAENRTRTFTWQRKSYSAQSDPSAPTDTSSEDWQSIPNQSSDNYRVSLLDYGHDLQCVLVYHEINGAEKKTVSPTIRCMPKATLEYKLADLLTRSPDQVKGTVSIDLGAIELPKGAVCQLNKHRVSPSNGRIQLTFDLNSIAPENTKDVQTWMQNVSTAKQEIMIAVQALRSFYSRLLTDSETPPESDLARSYMLSLINSKEPIEFIDSFDNLVAFEQNVERLYSLTKQEHLGQQPRPGQQPPLPILPVTRNPELLALENKLFVTDELYPHSRKRVDKQEDPKTIALERQQIMDRFVNYISKDPKINTARVNLHSKVDSAIDQLLQSLRREIQLLHLEDKPPVVSIVQDTPSEIKSRTQKELLSFPILLQLKIVPDDRYSKFMK